MPRPKYSQHKPMGTEQAYWEMFGWMHKAFMKHHINVYKQAFLQR